MRVDGRGNAGTKQGSDKGALWDTAVLPLGLLLLVSACSPAAFALHERSAVRALAAARAQGADMRATYEFVLAGLYLDKAREESSEAHYAWALELLSKSEQNARRAYRLSEDRGRTLARPDQGNAR